MPHKVICINRRCGSGGHIIGEMAANELGIKYYDRNLLDMALEYGGLDKANGFHKADEKATSSAFYRLQYKGNEKVVKGKPVNDTLFQLQRDLMREITQKEDCILVGRCADFILDRKKVNFLSVFVTAPFDFRVRQIMEQNNLSKHEAVIHTKKTDKRRSDYYHYFTKRDWTNTKNYEIILNSQALGFQNCTKLLCDCYRNLL